MPRLLSLSLSIWFNKPIQLKLTYFIHKNRFDWNSDLCFSFWHFIIISAVIITFIWPASSAHSNVDFVLYTLTLTYIICVEHLIFDLGSFFLLLLLVSTFIRFCLCVHYFFFLIVICSVLFLFLCVSAVNRLNPTGSCSTSRWESYCRKFLATKRCEFWCLDLMRLVKQVRMTQHFFSILDALFKLVTTHIVVDRFVVLFLELN